MDVERGFTWRSENFIHGAVPLAARLSICAIFAQAAMGKFFDWSGQVAYMSHHGMSMIGPLLAAAAVIEVLGIVSLLVGYQARAFALVMAIYLGIVSVRLHNFWALSGMQQLMGQTEFLKNVAILGGLLMIVAFGPGRWSIDSQRRTAVAECQHKDPELVTGSF